MNLKMRNLLVSIAGVRLRQCLFERTLLFLDSFLNEDMTNHFLFCLVPPNKCIIARGYCTSPLRLCIEGYQPCPLEGCPNLYTCCWYVSHSRRNNFENTDS